jgi:hypothetical protein
MSQLRWIAGWHVYRTAIFDLGSGRWLRRRIGRVAGKTKKQNGKRQGRINTIHGHSPSQVAPKWNDHGPFHRQ